MAKYLTQKQIAPFVRDKLGIPLGNSTALKQCSPAIGGGPPVAARLGRRPLYEIEAVIAWAQALLRPAADPPNDRHAA
jgi:hypothetical protein